MTSTASAATTACTTTPASPAIFRLLSEQDDWRHVACNNDFLRRSASAGRLAELSPVQSKRVLLVKVLQK
jgi:hypothetical protein